MPKLPIKIIGQTGKTFHTRYKKYIQEIRSTNGNFGYSNHKLKTGHTNGNIKGTIDIIKIEKNGKQLNALEKYHIVMCRVYA
jgi:hypothetical protein